MARVKGAGSNKDWLDIGIKAVVTLILMSAVAFGSYYYYNRTQQEETVFSSEIVVNAEQMVRKNPRNIGARVSLGRAYLANRRYDEAIEQFKEALKLDKENQSALVYMGLAYMQKGDDKNALKQFALEVELYSKAGFAMENNWLEQAYYNTAAILWKQKKYEQALININEAANINRTDADVHFLAGRIFLDKGSYEQAAEAFDKALSFDINFIDAAYGLGNAYEKMGEIGKAAASYRMAATKDKAFKDAVKGHERLLKKLKSDLEKKPNDAKVNYEMGMYYYGQEDYKNARKYLNKAIKEKKDFLLAHFYLGNIHENLNEFEEAKKKYEEVLKIDPNYEKAKQHLESLTNKKENV